MEAGKLAGLNVRKLLNEPTAAAVAYDLENNKKGSQKVLVYDLGGGTLDVAVLSISENEIKVNSVTGDCNLGGLNFDQRIFERAKAEFFAQSGLDFSQDKRAVTRLLAMSEKAKMKLSNISETDLNIDYLFRGEDLLLEMSKLEFEVLCKDLFLQTIASVKRALEDSKTEKGGIDSIVMVGGSTRIPYIHKLVTEYFGKEAIPQINPDEAVAQGAAIEAFRLTDLGGMIKELSLIDVTPLSVGVTGFYDQVLLKCPRNSPLPARLKSTFSSAKNYQTEINIDIVEGERPRASANRTLGSINLKGIKPRRVNISKIDVFLDIDANGILKATAIELSNPDNRISLDINYFDRIRPGEEIKDSLKEAADNKVVDETFEKQQKVLHRFDTFLRAIDDLCHEATEKGDVHPGLCLLIETRIWFDKNLEAPAEILSKRFESFLESFQAL